MTAAQIAMTIVTAVMLPLLAWGGRTMERQGRDIAVIREQLTPAGGTPLRAAVDDLTVETARLRVELDTLKQGELR